MARWNLELPKELGPVAQYGVSVLSVAIALGLALVLERQGFRDVELPLFEFAIVLTAWFAGVGPSVLAVLLCCVCYTYFSPSRAIRSKSRQKICRASRCS
jgi:K+-sensing histidine kinase KdpD